MILCFCRLVFIVDCSGAFGACGLKRCVERSRNRAEVYDFDQRGIISYRKHDVKNEVQAYLSFSFFCAVIERSRNIKTKGHNVISLNES